MYDDDETPPTFWELAAWAIILGLFAGLILFALHFNPA